MIDKVTTNYKELWIPFFCAFSFSFTLHDSLDKSHFSHGFHFFPVFFEISHIFCKFYENERLGCIRFICVDTEPAQLFRFYRCYHSWWSIFPPINAQRHQFCLQFSLCSFDGLILSGVSPILKKLWLRREEDKELIDAKEAASAVDKGKFLIGLFWFNIKYNWCPQKSLSFCWKLDRSPL